MEQVRHRLGVAEGVLRELEDPLQKVTAGHQASHEALQSNKKSMSCAVKSDTRQRTRLMEPKSFVARSVRAEARCELEKLVVLDKELCWSGVCSAETGTVACRKKRKQQISESNLEVFGVTTEVDQGLQLFLVSWTEGEALEVSRGTEREPRLEQWRRRTALYDILAAAKSGRQQANLISAQKTRQHRKKTSRTPSKPGKTLNQDSGNALETTYSRHATCYFPVYVSYNSREI